MGDEITLTGSEGDVSLEVTGRYLNENEGDFFVTFPTGDEPVRRRRGRADARGVRRLGGAR
ncbi:hypothetical protein [Demequina litorisediminis]|uniref:Uncharacterized protein n=1 Tax=Demequina litorisediminis TaxID=1849022 RepID=A0ABQ6IG56_9MICO|nr:hypothetical protein [Demequina litorisediminis]GMA36152.1 hypothetical protein GCM10025876_23560 [Demequina litorisediminis]